MERVQQTAVLRKRVELAQQQQRQQRGGTNKHTRLQRIVAFRQAGEEKQGADPQQQKKRRDELRKPARRRPGGQGGVDPNLAPHSGALDRAAAQGNQHISQRPAEVQEGPCLVGVVENFEGENGIRQHDQRHADGQRQGSGALRRSIGAPEQDGQAAEYDEVEGRIGGGGHLAKQGGSHRPEGSGQEGNTN